MSKHNHSQDNKAGTQAGSSAAEAGKSSASREGTVPAGENPAANSHSLSGSAEAKTDSARSPSGSVAPDASGENSPESNKQDKDAIIADLEAKLADLNDQYLRKAADFENFRKRMNREKQESSEYANQSLILDLLPVLDDFERALKSAESSRDFASFYEGISMIEKRLSTELENKWGLKRFDSAGQPFDPNRHEALQMEKAPDIEEAMVKEDFVKGYTLKDRVLRFAKVKVLMPDEGKSSSEAEGKK
jgi:molecular chaperone GrpE